jgi:hypothetical protein
VIRIDVANGNVQAMDINGESGKVTAASPAPSAAPARADGLLKRSS